MPTWERIRLSGLRPAIAAPFGQVMVDPGCQVVANLEDETKIRRCLRPKNVPLDANMLTAATMVNTGWELWYGEWNASGSELRASITRSVAFANRGLPGHLTNPPFETFPSGVRPQVLHSQS